MKKSIIVILFLSFTSIIKGQNLTLQSFGNLCIANHERIFTSAYPSFQIEGINFDTIHVYPTTASFLDNSSGKLFIAPNNGTFASPSFSSLVSLYYNPLNYKGNSVSGKLNSDNLTDLALVNAIGNIYTFKNNNYPVAFQKDSIMNSFGGGHVCSKLLMCNLDGTGAADLVHFGVKTFSNQAFVVKPYLNSNSTNTLIFSSPGIKMITNMPSTSNYSYDVQASDIDGNGKDELVFASEVLDSIYVIYSQFGILDKQFQFSPGPGFTNKKIVISDMNGDGKKEIAISGKTSSTNVNYVVIYSPIYISGTLAGFSAYTPIYTTFDIIGYNFGDLNADGFKDLVVGQMSSTVTAASGISIYMHNRSNPFQFSGSPINFNIANHKAGGIAICDVDNNKRPDIISYCKTDTGSIAILKNFTLRDSLYAVPNKSIICVGDTLVLKNQLLGFTGSYFTNIVPSLSLVASTNHSVSVANASTYFYNITYSPNISLGTCSIKSNDLFIIQGIQPSLTVNSPTSICYNTPVILTAGGASTFTWLTSSGTVITNFLSLTPTTSVVYQVSGSSTDGCKAFYNGTLTVNPDFNATVTYDKNFLCKDQMAKLSAAGGASYLWSTGQNIQNIVITQTTSSAQTYSVYITNSNGCSKYATFTTNYNDKCKEVKVIKGITPNSDGDNDHLYIENIENYPDNIVTIYNRWGAQLFSQKGYDNASKVWPAKMENNLVSGTYYYIVDLGPGNEIKKGWIEIFSN